MVTNQASMPRTANPVRTTREALLPRQSAYVLPPIVPVVADTNVFLNDVLYSVRRDRLTGLQRALRSGSMRCFVGHHVPAELQKHLPRRAGEVGVSFDRVAECWKTRYAPFVRVVNLSSYAPDDDRVLAVESRDATDAPTAALAMLVAPAAVLAEDHDLTDNGIGVREWLPLARAAGDLGSVDEATLVTLTGLTMATSLTAVFIEQVRGSRLLQNVLLFTAGAIGALAITNRRKLPLIWERALRPLAEAAGIAYIEQRERRRLATALLSSVSVQSSSAELIQAIGRSLAVAPVPATATAITRYIRERYTDLPYRETFLAVRSLLTTNRAFVPVGRHGWILGEPRTIAFPRVGE